MRGGPRCTCPVGDVPHSPQNFAWGSGVGPALGAAGLREAPHSMQNFAPSGVAASQRGQRTEGPSGTAMLAVEAWMAAALPHAPDRHIIDGVSVLQEAAGVKRKAPGGTRRRSGATVLFVKGPWHAMRSAPPQVAMGRVFHHGVQDRQQLAHTGRQRNLRRLTSGPQALVERFE